MSLKCIKPLLVEFTGAIKVDDAMDFVITKEEVRNIGLAINTKHLYLTKKEEEEKIDPPIEVDSPCGNGEKMLIDTVTLTKLFINGDIDFIVSADILINSPDTIMPDGIPLAWPSTSGQVSIENEVLAYADILDGEYKPQVTAQNVKLDDMFIAVDSGLYIFLISGQFLIEAIPVI